VKVGQRREKAASGVAAHRVNDDYGLTWPWRYTVVLDANLAAVSRFSAQIGAAVACSGHGFASFVNSQMSQP